MNINTFKRKFSKIHFIGIGGISMSALARLCIFYGVRVSGSDLIKTDLTIFLESLGAEITYNHSENNVDYQSLVVYTSAVGENNIELIKAKELGIKIMERSDFLGLIAKFYKNVIAIGGTHGKTTTTAMLGCVFESAGLKPTVHLGGECNNFNGNLLLGKKDFLITEACEYKKHFLKIKSDVSVVLNAEFDHPDSYKNLDEIKSSFEKFALLSKKCSVININSNLKLKGQRVFTFGFNRGTYTANNIVVRKNGAMLFDCFRQDVFLGRVKLNALGKHNILNALATIAVADFFEIDFQYILKGLENFCGVKRRMELLKEENSLFLHDYAHHPTEIVTTIKSVKEIFKKPIVAVFQPHTYTRTLSLFKEFCSAFNGVEELIILPTYPAREKVLEGGMAEDLFKSVKKHKKNTKFFENFDDCIKYLKLMKNKIVLILGAGDVYEMCKNLKE